MEHASAEEVRQHLRADLPYQQGMVRFIENHDEPRAASSFPGAKGRAAAVTMLTLPGARLLHEGQFEGRTVRLPVFLGRRPTEAPDTDLPRVLRRPAGGHEGDALPERRLAPLQSKRLARQPELPATPHVVLGEGRRACAGRGELRPAGRPGGGPCAVGRVAGTPVAPRRCRGGGQLPTQWQRRARGRPLRRPGPLAVPSVPRSACLIDGAIRRSRLSRSPHREVVNCKVSRIRSYSRRRLPGAMTMRRLALSLVATVLVVGSAAATVRLIAQQPAARPPRPSSPEGCRCASGHSA